MANIEIIIAKLPALIADRTDSLKLETAIRYVGDIIFDASQNRDGEKARALARVLSGPASSEEVQSREAILTPFARWIPGSIRRLYRMERYCPGDGNLPGTVADGTLQSEIRRGGYSKGRCINPDAQRTSRFDRGGAGAGRG
jgi:hypothetical protein